MILGQPFGVVTGIGVIMAGVVVNNASCRL